MSIKGFLKILPLGVVLPLVLTAAVIEPDVATANLSKWAQKLGMQDIPSWLSNPHTLIVWGLVSAVAYVIIMWVVLPYIKKQNTPAPPERFIPMPEAATRAYEEFKKSNSAWAKEADAYRDSMLGETPEESVLLYLASALSHGDVPLYGKQPPSRERELISLEERPYGSFGSCGSTFHYHGNKEPKYIGVSVKESDLEEAIKRMKDY